MENIKHFINIDGYLTINGNDCHLHISDVGDIKIIERTDSHDVIYFEKYDAYFKRNLVNLKYYAKYTGKRGYIEASKWYEVKIQKVTKVIFK